MRLLLLFVALSLGVAQTASAQVVNSSRLIPILSTDVAAVPGMDDLLVVNPMHGSLVRLNPRTGVPTDSLAVPKWSSGITVAPGGETAYVTTPNAVIEVDIPAWRIRRVLDLPEYPREGYKPNPGSVVVVPGMENTVVVSLGGGSAGWFAGLLAYRDGTLFFTQHGFAEPGPVGLVAGDLPGRLYGFSSDGHYYRLEVTEHEVRVISEDRAYWLLSPQEGAVQFARGRLYFTGGLVMDAEARRHVGRFDNYGFYGMVQALGVDEEVGRAYFLIREDHGNRLPAQLRAFDLETLRPIAQHDTESSDYLGRKMVRWGENGFAVAAGDGVLLLESYLRSESFASLVGPALPVHMGTTDTTIGRSVWIRNAGTTEAVIERVAATGVFRATARATRIAAGDSVAVDLVFDPLRYGNWCGTVQIDGRASGLNATSAAFEVCGNSTVPDVVYRSERIINFPTVEAGKQSQGSLLVANVQAKAVTLNIRVPHDSPFRYAGPDTTLSFSPVAGGTKTLSFSFSPERPGIFETKAIVTIAETGAADTLVLKGEGYVFALPRIVPAQISFGTVAVGASHSQPVWVHNGGLDTMRVSRVSSNMPYFQFSPETFTILPGDSLQATVSFTAPRAGSFAETFRLEGNFSPALLLHASSSVSPAEDEPGFGLLEPRPNPARHQVLIRFTLEQAAAAEIALFSATGHLIRRIVLPAAAAGRNAVTLDVGDLGPGTYFYRLTADGRTAVRSLTVIR